jgi:hypothetical protein
MPPVIILTAKDGSMIASRAGLRCRRLSGEALLPGGDVTAQALVRRAYGQQDAVLRVGSLTIDTNAPRGAGRTVRRTGGTEIALLEYCAPARSGGDAHGDLGSMSNRSGGSGSNVVDVSSGICARNFISRSFRRSFTLDAVMATPRRKPEMKSIRWRLIVNITSGVTVCWGWARRWRSFEFGNPVCGAGPWP